MVKHNNQVPNRHFHKDWQVRERGAVCVGVGGWRGDGDGEGCGGSLALTVFSGRVSVSVQVRVRTWFNQPGKKRSRRLKRDAKVRSRAETQPGARQPRGGRLEVQLRRRPRQAEDTRGEGGTAPVLGRARVVVGSHPRGALRAQAQALTMVCVVLFLIRRPRRTSRARWPEPSAPQSARRRSATT